jgi:hypothetical protein
MQNPSTYAKAIVAGTGAAVTGITTSASDGNFTTVEIVIVVLSTIGAAAATWAIPNKDEKAEAQEQSVQPPSGEGEYTDGIVG